jgi:hypothetical protein
MPAQPQQRKTNFGEQGVKVFLAAGFAYILIRSCLEFYAVAWGTGIWLGEFSLKWGIGFFFFVLFCILTWAGALLAMWKLSVFGEIPDRIVSLRGKLRAFRWVVVIILLVLPVWFLQYTPWGIVFDELYFRLLIWIYAVFGLAVFLKSGDRLIGWSTILAAMLLTSSVFSLAFAFINVSDYPFSIGWSEGNRMWDYSLFFGRYLYDYPVDKAIFATTDAGRQLVGGLPFIVPGVSILVERSWVALTTVLPYLMLGFAAFRFTAKDKKLWFLLGFWTFIFLKQGPIHPPLVLCAFVVALLWRSPLWVAIPLLFVTSYLAEESRYTWMFAPGLWMVMLEFSGTKLQDGRLKASTWWRAIILGLAGAFGGFYGGAIWRWVRATMERIASGPASPSVVAPVAPGIPSVAPSVSVDSVTSSITAQPLLWYRLFPNATYGIGILLALLIAVMPTVLLLFYIASTRKWILNTWQKLALIIPLLAFLVVGLIISTKIGGGGDLHNMDMFLIGVLFAAVIAWENGGRRWLREIDTSPFWVKGTLALLLVIPGVYPLSSLRSDHFAEDASWLVTLTDAPDEKFLEMLPPQEEVDEILQTIRHEVDARKSQGEILFMDQRQLLSFGYVENVPLVPEYEKKVLMNSAMSGDARYFQELYAELAAKRFSLIISEPLRAPVQDSSYQFGEENNAWVQWVVRPVLCYYDEIETFRRPQIQLLVPKQGEVDCSDELPIPLEPQK